jgi:hypothetical protein
MAKDILIQLRHSTCSRPNVSLSARGKIRRRCLESVFWLVIAVLDAHFTMTGLHM